MSCRTSFRSSPRPTMSGFEFYGTIRIPDGIVACPAWRVASVWIRLSRNCSNGSDAARTAVLAAVVAIDAAIKKMVRASDACRRLMTVPGVGQLTAMAFAAAVDDPERFKRSRDLGAYFGLVPRRYQSGEVDYTGGISK